MLTLHSHPSISPACPLLGLSSPLLSCRTEHGVPFAAEEEWAQKETREEEDERLCALYFEQDAGIKTEKPKLPLRSSSGSLLRPGTDSAARLAVREVLYAGDVTAKHPSLPVQQGLPLPALVSAKVPVRVQIDCPSSCVLGPARPLSAASAVCHPFSSPLSPLTDISHTGFPCLNSLLPLYTHVYTVVLNI